MIDAQLEINDFPAGLTHGSHFMADISKQREVIMHVHVGANRSRFAELSLLYGLAHCQHDHQFFYQRGTNLVFSLDHGHLFPNGPDWTVDRLQTMPRAIPDKTIEAGCSLTAMELKSARSLLERITNEVLAAAVASIPDGWRVIEAERVELLVYLEKRREELLKDLA